MRLCFIWVGSESECHKWLNVWYGIRIAYGINELKLLFTQRYQIYKGQTKSRNSQNSFQSGVRFVVKIRMKKLCVCEPRARLRPAA